MPARATGPLASSRITGVRRVGPGAPDSGARLVDGVLEQLFERQQVAGLDLLRGPRVPEGRGVRGKHAEQRLAVVREDPDRPLLQLG
jgi:hypothetical protein